MADDDLEEEARMLVRDRYCNDCRVPLLFNESSSMTPYSQAKRHIKYNKIHISTTGTHRIDGFATEPILRVQPASTANEVMIVVIYSVVQKPLVLTA